MLTQPLAQGLGNGKTGESVLAQAQLSEPCAEHRERDLCEADILNSDVCQLAAECVSRQQGGEYVRVVVGVLPAGIGEQALAPLAEVSRSILVHLREYPLCVGQPLSLWDGPNNLVKERIFLSADDVDHERPVGGAEGHGLL